MGQDTKVIRKILTFIDCLRILATAYLVERTLFVGDKKAGAKWDGILRYYLHLLFYYLKMILEILAYRGHFS